MTSPDQSIHLPRLGDTWLVITETASGVVVGCPGCGAQQFFEACEEPAIEHASVDCPVFQMITTALRHFIEGGKSIVV
jgi:hypothetical protein